MIGARRFMQKAKSREGKSTVRGRKSGRTSFDKSGRGIWEWQTATGVFEQNITDQQLAELENSQLTFIDAANDQRKEDVAVSYYEWQERSIRPVKLSLEETRSSDVGSLRRLLNRLVGKS
jgi:hypothetical protein